MRSPPGWDRLAPSSLQARVLVSSHPKEFGDRDKAVAARLQPVDYAWKGLPRCLAALVHHVKEHDRAGSSSLEDMINHQFGVLGKARGTIGLNVLSNCDAVV